MEHRPTNSRRCLGRLSGGGSCPLDTASGRCARHSLGAHEIGGGKVGRADSRTRRHGKGEGRRRRRSRVLSRSAPHSRFEATSERRIVGEVVDWILFGGLVGVMVGAGLVVGLPSWGLWILALVAAPLLLTVYEIAAIATWGATLGRRFAGVRVVRADTLEAPGWRRAAVRTIALVPWCGPPRGFERYALRRAYGLPDRLAGTIVVDDRAWRSSQRAGTRREDAEAIPRP
jgi:uncharacterized RDD family membrane protein YckC